MNEETRAQFVNSFVSAYLAEFSVKYATEMSITKSLNDENEWRSVYSRQASFALFLARIALEELEKKANNESN